ncbi:DUF1648 domain-containing protein [Vagococcus sp. PNs007]|uniref:DUF1648 domain-containing protein n=1 Tax=Vagococcus proximus TaxID=2991417 RepID=A0ABT5WZ54_9ENTE|nr:DUF1648 domain-containing protein [Vagococcus proximus]MDF0479047.1 DUF1648 domain-containing protein [Vagococcus proximus]
MEKVDWKTAIITSVVTLLPIGAGLYFYKDLPERMAIHFDINNVADGFASKNVTLFLLPLFMAAVQLFTCVMSDRKKEAGYKPKIDYIFKWIIPILSFIVYGLTLAVGLNKPVDIRVVICLVLGLIFMIIGNYLPKTRGNYSSSNRPFRKVKSSSVMKEYNRVMGYVFLIIGLLMVVSIFFAPVVSAAVIVIFVVISIAMGLYYMRKGR